LNYLLIFGKAGFPRMEVEGAAWASVISIALGTVTLMVMAARDGLFRDVRIFGGETVSMMKDIGSLGWPLFINMVVWKGGMLVYLKIIAAYGAAATALWGISSTFTSVVFIFIIGFRTNAAVITGQLLGASKYTEAFAYAKKAIRFVMLAGLAPVLALVALAGIIPAWFKFPSDGYSLAVIIIVLTGLKQITNTASSIMSHIIIAGKDSKIVMRITILALLCVGLPGTYVTGIVMKWGMIAVFIAIMAEDFIKAFLYYMRFISGKWMRAGESVVA
jgi:Na+-driven multidrug efflux pump